MRFTCSIDDSHPCECPVGRGEGLSIKECEIISPYCLRLAWHRRPSPIRKRPKRSRRGKYDAKAPLGVLSYGHVRKLHIKRTHRTPIWRILFVLIHQLNNHSLEFRPNRIPLLHNQLKALLVNPIWQTRSRYKSQNLLVSATVEVCLALPICRPGCVHAFRCRTIDKLSRAPTKSQEHYVHN